MKERQLVPVFFAADENYIPFLAVSLTSLKEHASKEKDYAVYILHAGIAEEKQAHLTRFSETHFTVEFVDVSEKLSKVCASLQLRDYYTSTTYYRVFIASMFPQYDKALYLDSDTLLLDDVANLFAVDVENELVAAIPDGAVQIIPPFQDYVKNALGIDPKKYFNAGILVMNLKKFREEDFYGRFSDLLVKYSFKVAQDQDYLNVLCKGKVRFLSDEWNRMPLTAERDGAKLIHYNLTQKPWHYEDVPYSGIFWEYAKKTEFYDEIKKELLSFTPEMAQRDKACEAGLIAMCLEEAKNEKNYIRLYGKTLENA